MKTLLIILLLVVSAVSASAESEENDTDTTDATATTLGEPDKDATTPVINPKLSSKLKKGDRTVDVIITMKDSTKSVHKSIRARTFPSRRMKLQTMVSDLQTLSLSSQRKFVNRVKLSNKLKHKTTESFWMTNQLIMRDVGKDDLTKLTEMKESNIDNIAEVMKFDFDDEIEEVFDGNADVAMEAEDPTQVQWGIAKIRCPEVWKTGIRGEGVIVATIDTGVRGTHEALSGNFLGEYGWYDPSGKTLIPNDNSGHGTHTMGILCGNKSGIGVAPGAKWMACKGCATKSCSQADLLACGQFILCPTLADKTKPDCSKAPHVVSNSWAGAVNGTWYDALMDAWNTADIKSTFAIGNSGPKCGTAQYPGNSNKTIGVASTDSDDKISPFSSLGPTADGTMMPLVAAPGSKVFSSYYTSDTAYATMSGTSMACPHVAGVVALLLQGEPTLNRTQVLTCLTDGCVKTNSTNSECGGVADTTFPNNHAGAGRIDAVQTMACLTDENESDSDEEYYY